MNAVYLDNNASTRVCDEAVEAMLPFYSRDFANPSSQHAMGQSARAAVDEARRRVAGLIGARPAEIVFTSGGTEADNLAILGVLRANPAKKHLIVSAVEHAAVFDLARRLEGDGLRVSRVPVDGQGRLDLAALRQLCAAGDAALVSVMHANNETGVIFPVEEIAGIAHAGAALLHADAAQSAGRFAIDAGAIGVDLLTLSSHKMHGPKGAGALYVRAGTRISGVAAGGHQERDLRPGTENVPAIVGFGAAARVARERLDRDVPRIAALRDSFERRMTACIPGAKVLASAAPRLCNTTCIAFDGVSAEALLIGLSQRGVCASNGSACASGAMEPSHVLAAMGLPRALADGAVRFSLSRETTEQELDDARRAVVEVLLRIAPDRVNKDSA